jgi:hypothetical protein
MLTQTPLSTSDLAQWVGALATVAAVVLALATTLYFEFYKARRDRPKLEIFYDNVSPQCRRLSQSPEGQSSSYFIRLKIVNKGNTSAQGCVGRLVEIANEDGTLRSDWDISGLTWSTQAIPEPIYLSPKGDYFYLDVVHIVEGEQVFRLRTVRIPRAIKMDFEPGQYYFHVVVYAEKAQPAEQWFKINWNGEFDKFFMEKTHKPNA